MDKGVDGVVVARDKQGVEGQQAGEDDEVFHEVAGGDAQGFERREAEFDRDGQQPGHALFGEGVHYEVAGNADDKGVPNKRDVDLGDDGMQEYQQPVGRIGNKRYAKQRVREEAVAAEQLVSETAE